MPPPNAAAYGHSPSEKPGHGMPESTSAVGSARLPVITLFEIVTVAPPEKPAFGGMSTPPPVAHTPGIPKKGIDSGLVCATPPVIVTPLIDTVGSVVAPNEPIVSTDPPPPLMVVAPGPAPISCKLFSI